MPPQDSAPSLYGITSANSSRSGTSLWGKNQFNSTFPLALCLYMRDNDLSPVSIVSRGDRILAEDRTWSMAEIVGDSSRKPYYHFEKTYDPYAKLSRNEVDKIDLVVSLGGRHAIPLEIKLTVVQDSTTVRSDESNWAPEMVMRPVSSAHAMMGVAASLLNPENQGDALLSSQKHPQPLVAGFLGPGKWDRRQQAVNALRNAYNKVSDWSNESEIVQRSEILVDALSKVLGIAESLQKPFMIQPLWKTKGQSLVLCNRCFDVFVWSDVSVMKIPVDQFTGDTGGKPRMNRPLREIARHVRALYDLLVTGDYDYTGIYKSMSLSNQTDKSFALSGKKNLKYLSHARLADPLLNKDVLHKLILNKGELELRPERRFDAAVLSNMSA
ncbi:MAG: HindVP family restriction endonuclease [Gammaproteobacteria bacterium]|nr:HindVP family restriction endonuclease [Gammaproteobacteria bacterium]